MNTNIQASLSSCHSLWRTPSPFLLCIASSLSERNLAEPINSHSKGDWFSMSSSFIRRRWRRFCKGGQDLGEQQICHDFPPNLLTVLCVIRRSFCLNWGYYSGSFQFTLDAFSLQSFPVLRLRIGRSTSPPSPWPDIYVIVRQWIDSQLSCCCWWDALGGSGGERTIE